MGGKSDSGRPQEMAGEGHSESRPHAQPRIALGTPSGTFVLAGLPMPTYSFRVNGRSASVESWDPDQPLLYVLRNQLSLARREVRVWPGPVRRVHGAHRRQVAPSCLTPVRQVAGHTVTTLEALGTPEKPDRVQAAFIAEQAAQCGYCTNGMIMAATALLRRTPHPTREQVTQGLATNLCRCGTHTRIISAVLRAAKTRPISQLVRVGREVEEP